MCRVLVGAPKADSKYSTSVKSPGAVFKCRVHTNPDRRCTELDMARGNSRGMPCGKTCREDRDDEWMGVSLARQPKADGRVLACAHRWKNIYYETDHILPHGFCYIIPSNLQAKGRTLIPCYEGECCPLSGTPAYMVPQAPPPSPSPPGGQCYVPRGPLGARRPAQVMRRGWRSHPRAHSVY